MATCYNKDGKIVKCPRPSPKTQGVTSEGETIQKFGTQQLKFIDPAKPALGVTQVDTGKAFKGFTTTVTNVLGIDFGAPTPFSQQIQSGVTGAYQGVSLRPQTPTNGNGTSDKCQECNAWDVPCELSHMLAGTCTPPTIDNGEECDLGCFLTGRGCDCGCKDVKPCTTCDSSVCVECNAWDLQCEDCKKKDGTCTPPTSDCGCLPLDFGCEIGCWWDKYKLIIMIIGGLIGLGFVLWLLRPLFGMIGAFKGGAP